MKVRTEDPSEVRRVNPSDRDGDPTLGDAGNEPRHGREDGEGPADDGSRVDTCVREEYNVAGQPCGESEGREAWTDHASTSRSTSRWACRTR